MVLFENYAEKFNYMREVGKYTSECLDELSEFIKPGITTKQVNEFVKNFGDKNLLENAQFGYKGFPAYCCVSLNEVMCHGLPNDNTIEAGVLKVDITFKKNDYHGDACRTYIIGQVQKEVENFVEIAHNALRVGIQACGPNVTFGKIGKAIEDYTKYNKVFVARHFIGHGIGKVFHDNPGISHVNDDKDIFYNVIMEPGMSFTIEPIVMMNSENYRTMSDGWGVRQKERKLTAQWEATIGITFDGYEIFCQ